MFVLVSQGIKIYETENEQEALDIMTRENKEYYKFLESLEDFEKPVDNKIFMYEE